MNLKELKAKVDELMLDPSNHELQVFVTEDHEYWGTIYSAAHECYMEPDVQGDGPKKPAYKAIVVC